MGTSRRYEGLLSGGEHGGRSIGCIQLFPDGSLALSSEMTMGIRTMGHCRASHSHSCISRKHGIHAKVQVAGFQSIVHMLHAARANRKAASSIFLPRQCPTTLSQSWWSLQLGPELPEKTEKLCLRRSRLVIGCYFLVGVITLLN